MAGRILYLVGGAPRVGKSVLAQRLLKTEGIPWLPTDVLRTVLRRVLPELDAVDQDPVDAVQLAELMYPHIEQAAELCAEEAGQFLIEGFELSPSYPARLQAALVGTTVRSCFLGHRSFSADDLASYRGPKPQHEREASRGELNEAAAWIRLRSQQLREECDEEGLLYLDTHPGASSGHTPGPDDAGSDLPSLRHRAVKIIHSRPAGHPVAGPARQQPGSIRAVPSQTGTAAPARRLSCSRAGCRSGVRCMFGSLDFIYVPTTDVDAEAQRHVDTLGAQLVWKVRGMGGTVACLRVGEPGRPSCSPDTCTAPARSW